MRVRKWNCSYCKVIIFIEDIKDEDTLNPVCPLCQEVSDMNFIDYIEIKEEE